MPPPSPRDMRNSQRSAQKRSIAHNRSLEFTSLEDCDNLMLKTCMGGKRKCSQGLEDSAATTGTARGNNGEARQEEDVVQERKHSPKKRASPEKRGEARREDERLAFTETLQRGGLLLQGACVLPTATTQQQHDLFASGANLIKRPRSASRASSSGHVSHTSSPDEKATGVANSDNGRHSRLSGRGLHSAVKLLTRAASSSSLINGGRSSSRNGSFNSISYPFSSTGSSSGSLMASSTGVLSAAVTRMRDIETPPGAPDALEAHKVLVHCPPPLRRTTHADRRADQVAPRGLSLANRRAVQAQPHGLSLM
jgi:hypothetical protein